ncbi:hypothetical protein EYF80_044053 [Liparis tanakae]|uniref:Uncharacterized protein n=1 Tax=Liparis tanakae TaxID=230148 RepID=A0A4Z2FYG8_9TELE|nr:hypothetical protein EYF80_044053 [Liparis tanakae]
MGETGGSERDGTERRGTGETGETGGVEMIALLSLIHQSVERVVAICRTDPERISSRCEPIACDILPEEKKRKKNVPLKNPRREAERRFEAETHRHRGQQRLQLKPRRDLNKDSEHQPPASERTDIIGQRVADEKHRCAARMQAIWFERTLGHGA